MRVGILGAGGIAFGAAAYLHLNGHDPILWSPSGASTRELVAGTPLKASGAIDLSFRVRIASSVEEAVATSDVILVAMPGNAHRMAFEAIARIVRSGQPTIISSHLSFGALYLSRLIADRGIVAPIIAWGTTLTTGRKQAPTEVGVNSVRSKIDVATVPESEIDTGLALCTELFGDRFVRRNGLLAISLSNLNPQNHLAISLFNLTRMERGERWGQAENVTPAVGRVMEELDAERLAIAAEFGLSVRSIKEHYSLSYQLPIASIADMNADLHNRGRGGFGPATMQSRYVLEDAPFGLWPTILLGRLVGRPASLHEAGLAMLSAAYGRSLADENDLLPLLGLQDLPRERLQELTRTGH
ncbi:NAD/NADP octopine/nopaline dehydrogenase family protein [Bosea sp. (in: a-proteobacteria)]|uniref:NAD/NADP octopine/nopaline dehydrogenase family protein n=1 Tax=Bosea sp. (in: a-proteobacteria) TaxID=1871050 RepID=UPI0011FF2576|nr:NAD/NADP octopine/nopaline dehydrogenase family protein [Bosea sp. (in: a-proteobacteria)]TAJ34103.1 MAG: NAD/NADP octopine/nopaline dehydrogenase [Bosea sp. (in: a-proteobacteria)]